MCDHSLPAVVIGVPVSCRLAGYSASFRKCGSEELLCLQRPATDGGAVPGVVGYGWSGMVGGMLGPGKQGLAQITDFGSLQDSSQTLVMDRKSYI